MRTGAAVLVLLALLFVSRGAKADDSGIGLSTGLMMFQPHLGSSTFSGSGTPYGGGPSQSFNQSGRTFGVSRPVLIGTELRLDYLERHFEVGAQLFYAARIGDPDAATEQTSTPIADPSSLSTTGGGIHAAIAIPTGIVTFVAGPDFGVRGFEVPLIGFRPTVCHSRYGTYSCPEEAWSIQPYFQPRAALIFHADAKSFPIFAGPWIGVDLIPSTSWAGGFVIGVGSDHNTLR